ncbi:hypothetical protein OC846_000155 [Tilletia horrida]|uniref:Uncharacterized protein n=1 Tax=Tilletia horrida TaxID=155126 RepID=A0AAN6GWC3_9BASI|nr:hypothetical protein OC846_000155 [Tilletia horrida]KAK0570095.1 hypothetical protein OC861_000237 [Tilletia horrida]
MTLSIMRSLQALFFVLALCSFQAAQAQNIGRIQECPTAAFKRGVPQPHINAAATVTNPSECTIGALPYPYTTWTLVSTAVSGTTYATYSIVSPTFSNPTTTFTPITTGPPIVIPTLSATNGTVSTASPSSSSSSSTTSTTAAPTTGNTGAGARRANPPPTNIKSIQRFSGLQISLTLFLGVAILAGIVYFLDELMDALV